MSTSPATAPSSVPTVYHDPLDPAELVHDALFVLARNGIVLVEWAEMLYRRMGYPAIPVDISFLFRDEHVDKACRIIAEECHLPVVDPQPLHAAAKGDFYTKGQHFLLTPHEGPEHPHSRCLALFPLSWAGFAEDELRPVSLRLSTIHPEHPEVLTVSPASLCAALVRLHCRARRNSPMARWLEMDLATIIFHSLFDASYEGDYVELKGNDPWMKEELDELETALDKFRCWNFRDGEVWIADALEAILAGRGDYNDLPALSGEEN